MKKGRNKCDPLKGCYFAQQVIFFLQDEQVREH